MLTKYKVILNCKNVKFNDPMKMTVSGTIKLKKLECEESELTEKLKSRLTQFVYATNLHEVLTSEDLQDVFSAEKFNVVKTINAYDESTLLKGVKVLILTGHNNDISVDVEIRKVG